MSGIIDDIKELTLAYSQGRQMVRIGDKFSDRSYGGDWEVVGFTGEMNYSPSGIGGSSTVRCRPLNGMPEYWRKWMLHDGTVDWCGDSVAACVAYSKAKPSGS
jgi:hypothetical protein